MCDKLMDFIMQEGAENRGFTGTMFLFCVGTETGHREYGGARGRREKIWYVRCVILSEKSRVSIVKMIHF